MSQSKVTMLAGLPGSGKSTTAKEMLKRSGKGGNLARVNRDELRLMLFDGIWTGKREQIVIEVEKAIAKVLIRNGHDVLVDDTNLTDKTKQMWDIFATTHQAKFDEKYLNVPIAECIERDALRGPKSVGPAVIYRLALNGGRIDFGNRKMILVDIDGTIADGEHRNHLTHGPNKNWPKYFSLLHQDKPIEHVIRWVNELAKDYTICIVSGRPDLHQRETVAWLKDVAGIHYDYLFMRSGSDTREDSIIKQEILNKLPKELIEFVIDDRPRVVRMWRQNGLRVIPVAGECEDF